MKHISISAFKEVLEAEKNNDSIDFINVCEIAEYKEKHIEGVRNVPLGTVGKNIAAFKDKKTIYVHCRSGARSQQAIKKLEAAGISAELVNVEGGILAWDAAGHATNALANRLPIMRQVLITAGALIIMGVVGGQLFHANFIYLTAFVGIGLVFSGVSGWCGMAFVLAKMPWNK